MLPQGPVGDRGCAALGDNNQERSWVWISDQASRRSGTLSVMAVAETIAASALGLWLWFHVGLYPMLLSSAVMAFLTMLRSDASIEKGARWFTAHEKQLNRETAPRWQMILSITLAALTAGISCFWLESLWPPGHSGWSPFWQSALVVFLAMNIGIMVGAAVAAIVAGAVVVVTSAASNAGMVSETVAGAEPIAILGGERLRE